MKFAPEWSTVIALGGAAYGLIIAGHGLESLACSSAEATKANVKSANSNEMAAEALTKLVNTSEVADALASCLTSRGGVATATSANTKK